jgi:rhodanese-related sulfurtransferase
MIERISRDELKAKIDSGDDFVLIEALDERYYRQSHLPGAINLPPKALERAEELLSDKGADIVVYCSGPQWTKSEEVARELAAMGYENVREYVGGKREWKRARLPTGGEGLERK